MDREILHVDMNNFYASVECLFHPELKGKAVAVGGSAENRRGIILAKNYAAKACGVKTGEALWQAKAKCPDLVVVSPHYDLYMQKSKQARAIYARYTDRIEAMGADENWLDITGCQRYLGKTATEVADEIRETVKLELGLTVSVGVSFNKVFAKLGSDMKKPDAVTVLERDNYYEKICSLPASDMICVGRATEKKLFSLGIYTIGDLAAYPLECLASKFGKVGVMLWRFANGLDSAAVCEKEAVIPIKSIGHGSTALSDLDNNTEVWEFILALSLDIGRRLRDHEKFACGVSVMVRDNTLKWQIYQKKFAYPTQSAMVLATEAYAIFLEKHTWSNPLRKLAVTAIYLADEGEDVQMDLFGSHAADVEREKLDSAVYDINNRFGRNALIPASLLCNPKLPDETDVEMIMPSTGFAYS